uniref:LRRCT domain-containing protein n=1 Tax=Mola mola TaxID=94237 RepID=A0A3Q3X1V9_MOLML
MKVYILTLNFIFEKVRLQLSNNSLVAIHNSTFSGLERLQELDLTLNSLKTVPKEGLQELDSLPGAVLLLSENPFMCKCGIEPFALWLNRSQGRIRDAKSLVCAFPASMRNTSILAVRTLTLGCHQRNVGADLALHFHCLVSNLSSLAMYKNDKQASGNLKGIKALSSPKTTTLLLFGSRSGGRVGGTIECRPAEIS